MKRKTITGLTALTLSIALTGGVALAADNDRGNRDHRDRGENTQQSDQDNTNDRGDRRHRRHNDQGQQQQQQQQQQPQPQYQAPQRTDIDNSNNNDRRWRGDNDHGDRGDRVRDDNNRDRNWGGNDRWRQNLDNRRDNRRIYWDRYRQNLTSPRRFSIGVYHAPRGYYYRRWHHGERLPRSFYVRDYWLTNFLLFGLFAPPSDELIWVRYGPDALLIDRYTGEIVQVRYNVFY